MADLPQGPQPRQAERLLGGTVDLLRRLGARRLANGLLRLLQAARRHEPAVPAAPPAVPGVPLGPFQTMPGPGAPALLIFVPRGIRSRLIDAATGGYGYSHLAVDCGEIDRATGKRVMVESMPGHPVRRVFLDTYGLRPFVRIPLPPGAGAARSIPGFDPQAFCACVASKIGEAYDSMEAITWGEVDDPARQICSDLAALCLPPETQADIASSYAAGRLPRRSVSAHHAGTPEFHAFVSPNALAAYFDVPPGERLRGPDYVHAVKKPGGPGKASRRLRRPRRVKLIFNPSAGGNAPAAGSRLTEILAEMQRCDLLPEVHVVTPQSHVQAVVADALRRGIRLIVISAGDGTIDEAMAALVGKSATLGIIPTGTRNNIAYSLGIPAGDLPAAVDLLRNGRRIKVDVARAHCNGTARWFLETAAVGLVSELYPAADRLQHGDLARVTELISDFVSAAPSRIRLTLDGDRQVEVDAAHAVLLANMPYFGARFHPSSGVQYDDGSLDVLVFGDLGKLDLLTYAVQLTAGMVDDPRVAQYRARSVEVYADPAMPAMADGVALGSGPLRVTLRPRALAVMAGDTAPSLPITPNVQQEVNDA